MMLDLLMLACGVVLLLAALIVLTVCKPAERSMRAVCALLIGCWGGLVISRALHGGHAYQVIDVIGPLAIALWISQACRAVAGATCGAAPTGWSSTRCSSRTVATM
jgi:hypothetical protein